MRHHLQQQITNMQIDMIRQFTQQESEIEDYLETIAINNRKQKDVIKQLSQEN